VDRASLPADVSSPTADSSKRLPRGELKTTLQFGFIHQGDWPPRKPPLPPGTPPPEPTFEDGFLSSLVVDVKNIQTATDNAAANTIAQVRFASDDGKSKFTLSRAPWLASEISEGFHSEGIRSQVDIYGGQSQAFVLLLFRKDGAAVGYEEHLRTMRGLCGVGHWVAAVTISSDNAPTIEAQIGFTVLRGNGFTIDTPAFVERNDLPSVGPDYETHLWRGQLRYRCRRAHCHYETYDLKTMQEHIRLDHKYTDIS
jgi:hypothetical protein